MWKFLGIALSIQFASGCANFSEFFQFSDSDIKQSSHSAFPERSASAITGSQFLAKTAAMTADQREHAILKELSSGNMPGFLRSGVPVRVIHRHGAQVLRGTFFVLPDYLAIGSDRDHIRIPMTPMVAQKLADRFGYVLPTRKMVNDTYAQAAIKLSPSPMPPGPLMVSNEYYAKHDRTIRGQLPKNYWGKLIAGHKKDVVITNRILSQPGRVAIYGWHRLNGVAIQPLSLVHGSNYADYSHGVRMVLSVMQVGAFKMYVSDVLKNRKYSGLLSDEGAMPNPRARTH